jgi:hypothetical protein
MRYLNRLTRERLLDKLIESYVDWREASAWVSYSYREWASDTDLGGGVAFGRYTAALDAEEHAAEIYAGLVERVRDLLWRQEPAARPSGEPARADAV